MSKKTRTVKAAHETPVVETLPVAQEPVAVQQEVAPQQETPAAEAKVSRRSTQKWAVGEAKDLLTAALAKPEAHRIVLAVKENPKRSQPKDRFQLYFAEGGLTVAEYIAKVTEMGKAGVKGSNATVAKADLSWDLGHGFINIEPIA